MGFIVSRKKNLKFRDVSASLPAALALAPHMELNCTDQPFMNYLVVTSGKRYTSLLSIARQSGRTDIPLERWAGKSLSDIRDGQIPVEPGKPPVLLVHWAGEWQRDWHMKNPLWRHYRDCERPELI